MNLRKASTSILSALILSFSLACTVQAADTIPSYDSLPRLGESNHLWMGAFNPLAEDASPANSLHAGSSHTDTWLAALMYNAEGKLYFIMQIEDQSGGSTLLFNTVINDMMVPDPRVPAMAPRRIINSYNSDEGLRFTASGADGSAMQATVNETGMNWSEAGMFEFSGRTATPGIYVSLPWRNGSQTGIETWATQDYPASGTIFGEEVSGFIHMDRNYDTVGYGDGQITARLHGFWSLWTNEYDDGSFETGVFTCGSDFLRGVVVADGNGVEIINTTDITVDMQYDGSTLVKTEFVIDGEEWVLKPELIAQYTMPERTGPDGELMTSWTGVFGGQTVRKNETRKLIRAWTAVEANTNHTCSPK